MTEKLPERFSMSDVLRSQVTGEQKAQTTLGGFHVPAISTRMIREHIGGGSRIAVGWTNEDHLTQGSENSGEGWQCQDHSSIYIHVAHSTY